MSVKKKGSDLVWIKTCLFEPGKKHPRRSESAYLICNSVLFNSADGSRFWLQFSSILGKMFLRESGKLVVLCMRLVEVRIDRFVMFHVCPGFLSNWFPLLCIVVALAAEMFYALIGLLVGADRSGAVNNFLKIIRVLQHGAGPQHVAVVRLGSTVALEERALADFENALLLDVRVAVVNEDAGLGISGRVNVEVLTSRGDAAVDILAVILEVHGEELNVTVRLTNMTDSLNNLHALFRCRKQVKNCVVTNGHVVEEESETGTLFGQEAEEVVAGDGVEIVLGVAD